MAAIPTDPKLLQDGISVCDGGVDTGKSPLIIGKNKLSYGLNLDLRGGFLKPRPGLRKIDLGYGTNTALETRQKSGKWQVAGYYAPDIGPECLLASIGGRQFKFNVGADNSVQEITIANNTTTTANFAPPAIGFNVTITVADATFLSVGATILVNGKNYTVQLIAGLSVTIKNVDDDGSTNPVVSGSAVVSYDPNPSNIEQAWEVQAEKWWILRDGPSVPFIYDGASSRRAMAGEVGPGRMMAYGMGRLWGALNDKRSFRGGDLVNGTSGTAGEDFRDAVLKETENTFQNGGGDFTTPMSAGGIAAMRFAATLDSSLGQGPLQVFTPKSTFSVMSPTDRTVWAALENPIQTISLISNGGLSHYGTILVNGDILYRAMDGIRSLVLARREFTSWGNTPISSEMDRVINLDDSDLLKFSSAVVFKNRLLMTASPFRTSHGITHRALIVMDMNLLSSLGQKAPSVYDGIWTGLNILQIVTGEFNGIERCFIFSLNREQEIELYELSASDKFDHQTQYGDDVPISWIFESSSQRFTSGLFPERKVLKKLNNLDIELSSLIGNVNFKVYWKPDGYPCWLLWREFSECAIYKDCDIDPLTGCQTLKNFKPQFRPRLSLGQPPDTCDPVTGRPLRNGYSFQVRFEVSGYAEIRQVTLACEELRETYYGEIVGCV